MSEHTLSYAELDAVAVSSGPGSYTGLRIGVSVAKGLCYAASKPLIAVSTLQGIALGASQSTQSQDFDAAYFIPMIDARRMEVYYAIYDKNMKLHQDVKAEIISESVFDNLPGKLVLCGDGAPKCVEMFENNPKILVLTNYLASAKRMGQEAFSKFQQGQFVDLAYFEPFYLKDFVAGLPRVKGLV
jgi:tRNA threonylcarbamoyladenosine biosynthesis protein TsaB